MEEYTATAVAASMIKSKPMAKVRLARTQDFTEEKWAHTEKECNLEEGRVGRYNDARAEVLVPHCSDHEHSAV
jgi:hypothetical protein